MPLSVSDKIAFAIAKLGQLQNERTSLKQMKSAYGYDLDASETEKRLTDIYDLTRKIDHQKMLVAMLKNQQTQGKKG